MHITSLKVLSSHTGAALGKRTRSSQTFFCLCASLSVCCCFSDLARGWPGSVPARGSHKVGPLEAQPCPRFHRSKSFMPPVMAVRMIQCRTNAPMTVKTSGASINIGIIRSLLGGPARVSLGCGQSDHYAANSSGPTTSTTGPTDLAITLTCRFFEMSFLVCWFTSRRFSSFRAFFAAHVPSVCPGCLGTSSSRNK
jgi:hypothetical protein